MKNKIKTTRKFKGKKAILCNLSKTSFVLQKWVNYSLLPAGLIILENTKMDTKTVINLSLHFR